MAEKRTTINEHELEILDFWNSQKIFEKSLEKTKDCDPYVFYDGPPFATGLPHYGHLLGSIIKDVYGRFWTMNDRYVKRVWGWDCHGLPVENIAEKALKINSKDEIEAMGVKKFNDYCRSQVSGYVDDWKRIINRIGRWVDMDNSYKTMDNEFIESVWWAFKQLWDKDYIYKGEKILMYCPRCSTPLAKAEIAMDNSYKKINDRTVVVKFKLSDSDVYALAWTTTPWTLPSNLALTVNPNLSYAYVNDNSSGETYIIAEDLVSSFYKSDSEYKIEKTVKGSELEGKTYEPLFSYFSDTRNAFKILSGDFVTAEDGTGIVHTAPAFGEEDYAICKENDIPLVQPVDDEGKFTSEVSDFSGMFVHDSNKTITDFLKAEGKVVLIKQISHEYPFCYRCDTKLLYRAIPAWFVNIQKIKPRLLELNEKLNWYPDFLKDGRVKYTLETAPDWNISRNRYWATAIPIWESDDGDRLVVGSIDELKQYAKNLPEGDIDLHKDYLDEVVLEKDGKTYTRVPEVLDCWFESGSMTFAQFHYPFENKDYFEKNFPAQFVAEYIAQIRTWFYYMNALSAILFDDVPFENVVTTGNILADDGQKMSKSKKNYPDPMILVEKYGVDALRFYLATSPVLNAQDLNFSERQVEDIYKKVLVLLYNVTNFYGLYEDISDEPLKPTHVMDKWILSRFSVFATQVTDYLKSYNTVKLGNEIRTFVDDLSTWYVRESRDRFNDGDAQAKATLRYVLESLSVVCAPLMPFVSEKMYQSINGSDSSVHLANWTSIDTSFVDEDLNHQMRLVRDVVSKALRIRDQSGVGLKWPVPKLKIYVDSSSGLENFEDVFKAQINVKDVSFSSPKDGVELDVELDVELSSELEAEGYTREVIRKVQAGRKKSGLVKEDRIVLSLSTDFDDFLRSHEEMILETVGAKKLLFLKESSSSDYTDSGKIKGKSYSLSFVKA